MKKRKTIILIVVFIALLICAVVCIIELRWKSYYKSVWVPIIQAFEDSGAEYYHGSYKLEKNNCYFCAFIPKNRQYDSNLQASESGFYDEEIIKEKQVQISLIIWPLKDGSFRWGVMIDEVKSLNNYVGILTVYFDPQTMKVTSEDATSTDYELFEKYEDRIETLVEYSFDIWGDTIK